MKKFIFLYWKISLLVHFTHSWICSLLEDRRHIFVQPCNTLSFIHIHVRTHSDGNELGWSYCSPSVLSTLWLTARSPNHRWELGLCCRRPPCMLDHNRWNPQTWECHALEGTKTRKNIQITKSIRALCTSFFVHANVANGFFSFYCPGTNKISVSKEMWHQPGNISFTQE